MAREPYDFVKEHEVVGEYIGVPGRYDGRAPFASPEPKLYRPITPRENFLRLFEKGKTPYWIPELGWYKADTVQFRPRQHPDNLANHQTLDGGPCPDWDSIGRTVIGWFDEPFEFEPVAGGCMVTPDYHVFEDANDWKDKLVFPNLDDLDWDDIAEMNMDFLSSDKINELGIQFGFWERMMNLMGVDNAACALLDEDQEEAIHELLDALADLYIDYITRMTKLFRIDMVQVHDDWGTQNAPFFSLETAYKFFVAPTKKLIDTLHDMGIIYEQHSCGKNETMVPAWIDEGVDIWYPQCWINDTDMLIEKYGGQGRLHFGVMCPALPKGSSDEELKELAHQWVEKYKDKEVILCQITGGSSVEGKDHDPSLYPLFKDYVYQFSRIAFQNNVD